MFLIKRHKIKLFQMGQITGGARRGPGGAKASLQKASGKSPTSTSDYICLVLTDLVEICWLDCLTNCKQAFNLWLQCHDLVAVTCYNNVRVYFRCKNNLGDCLSQDYAHIKTLIIT